MCKHFKVVRNEFKNTINGVCILYRKGICGCCDITLITPNSMLNGKVSDMPPIDEDRIAYNELRDYMANWIPSGKYFIKCSNCGYELFNSYRIATPRKCPRCDKFMYEVIRRKSK